MKSPKYGKFDFDSIGERVRSRKVYGSGPKVMDDPESFFECFKSHMDVTQSTRKTEPKGLDRAAFIIDRIRDLENDIERYKDMGRVFDGIVYNKPVYFNFRRLIPKVEREIQELYEFL